ncbi:MAG TPA: helix-hairpin-helix domain-containing protein [Rhizomicrobium sp.]|jgi:hypothetical protein|nr:helix-hairpin-helix domain-containing protein [Rhizomicrobium sp.]
MLSLLSAPPALAQQKEATTPVAAVAKVCTGCHSLQIVTDTPKDYNAWHDTVQEMIDRGAQGTPAEFDLVMEYLFENMTMIDVNHADSDTLATVLHAPPAAVASIIAKRQTHPFKSVADLEASVPGLDKAALENKKRMIFFQ